MALVPSFSAYAQTPDLSEAYLGGQRLALARDQLAQEAAAASARISLGYEQIAANRVANEMELAAKREVLSRQALMKAQEQEIEKAYRETQFGLAERKLASDEARAQMEIRQAASAFERQQRYDRRFKELEPTLGAEGAARQATLETAGMGFGTALRPKPGLPQDTASDRNLRFKILTQQKEDAGIKFGPRSPEYQQEIDRIDKEINTLLTVPGSQSSSISQPPRALTPPSWIVDPSAIPAGSRRTEIFMGDPSRPVVQDPAMAPLSLPTSATPATSTSRMPRQGDVLKGYRFKGGDPSMRDNWEKVK